MAKHPECEKARRVVAQSIKSVEGFFSAFETVRRVEGGKGAPTSAQLDLARAALVFACAGLDSSVKHLIKESIESLCKKDSDVEAKLVKFVRRVVEDDSSHRLAWALLADSPRQQMIKSYIYDLTGSSLQSFEELASAAGALGIQVKELTKKKKRLEEIFEKRNVIIHELDVTFAGSVGRRNRNPRSRDELKADTQLILETAREFVAAVEAKLSE